MAVDETETQNEVWNTRQEDESLKAFNAFCMYRAMGWRRSIRACLEVHGIDQKRYGSWARWARLFDWKERAAKYDEYIAKETEKGIISAHVEHRRCYMDMLGKMAQVVDKSIGSLEAKDIDAGRAMDLLERTAKLDGYLCGENGESAKDEGQLAIRFVDDFKGL